MIKRKKFIYFCLLLFLSLLPLKSLFHPGLFVSHDGRDHVARIANFYQSLSEGNLLPRWAKNLNWGYGHPVVMFLYPLSSYLGSFFHFLGFSFINSTKLVFAIGFISSGLFMFLWIKEIWGRKAAVLAGVLYLFAPYRFVNLYVRGAIGENMAFPFVPLVCYFLYKLNQKLEYKYGVGASLSLALLILAHNALSLMFLPFIIFYIFYLNFDRRENNSLAVWLPSCLTVLLGFILSAFFWLPAFYEGKYTLRDIVISPQNLLINFPGLKKLIFPPWSVFKLGKEPSDLYFFIGFGAILVFIVSFYVFRWLKKNNQKEWLLIGFTQLYFFFSFSMMTRTSFPLWQKISFLQKFQFPWRFLSVAVFSSAVLGASIFKVIKKSKTKLIVLLFSCSLVVFSSYSLWQVKEYSYQPESFYTGVFPSTTDTGESSPRWSVRFMEKKPDKWVEVIEGITRVENLKRTTNLHTFNVKAESPSRLVDNTLYFPGWQVLVDNQKREIEFQDPSYRGLITFWVEQGEHQVKIVFGETCFRQCSNLISLLGLLILIGTAFFWPSLRIAINKLK